MSKLVLEELQAYLVSQGVGRMPDNKLTEPQATPSIWTLPRQGTALPARSKDGSEWLETIAVTLEDTNLMGPLGVESWLEDCFVSVTTRAKNAGEGKLLQRTIKNLLHPVGTRPGGRQGWMMNTLRVQLSKTWRADIALPIAEAGLTYDRVSYYQIRCARSDLG